MKKHKFKLEAVLKLREAKEKKIKTELGNVTKEIQKVKDRLIQIDNEVEVYYDSQEHSVSESGTAGRMIRFYPEAVRGLKSDKVVTENLLSALNRKYERKVAELKAAMGDTKIMSNMKEKDFKAFKKEAAKKEVSDLEEILMMRTKESHS